MQPSLFSISLAALSSGQVAALSASSQFQVAESVARAIIYAYPLALYEQTFYNTTVNFGTNTINRGNATSTASVPILVRPNADYVYSPVALDLSHKDVELTLPVVDKGRSYVFPFYDLYGNNYANLGSATASPPGKYLVRLALGSEPGLVINHADYPQYQGVISAATTWGSMMIRIVTYGTSTDLDKVVQLESAADLSEISRKGSPSGPALTPGPVQISNAITAIALKTPYALNATDVTNLLSFMAGAEAYNPPGNASYHARVTAMLSAAGISNGTYNPHPDLNLTLVNALIAEKFSKKLSPETSPQDFLDLGGNWLNYVPSVIGDFHAHAIFRAQVAYSGYLALVSTECVYPQYLPPNATSAHLSLTTNESYIVRFSAKPPAQFWSLTAYVDNYLIPNGLDRYSLHQKSKITYPDGTLVYGGDSVRDGPFEILLQVADVAPPANWTSNWLPAPAGGGSFDVNVRGYGPSIALSNGSYIYPVVVKGAAIV